MRSTWLPRDAARFFDGVGAPWWVAGGHGLDLFLGRPTREHEDLDVAILRRDQLAFQARLAGWDLHVGAGAGKLAGPWRAGEKVPEERPAAWCRPSPEAPWGFELLLSEAEGDAWVFPRDARVRRPLASLGVDVAGVPVLAPEVILLFKAKAPRERDEADFANALPALGEKRKGWLREALEVAHPGHAWLARL